MLQTGVRRVRRGPEPRWRRRVARSSLEALFAEGVPKASDPDSLFFVLHPTR
jgi:hypothetical protein